MVESPATGAVSVTIPGWSALRRGDVPPTLGDDPQTSNAELITNVADAPNWPPLNAAYVTGAAIQAY
ncbi:MAG: hypothetical protein PHQ28_08535 [Mycobacterium sp.]|nr:hypothetical protein [Mycobacterium sp.]